MNRNSQTHTAARREFAASLPAIPILFHATTRRVRCLARLLFGAAIALVILAMAQPASAAAPGDGDVSNTKSSSTGAYLQSAGMCDGGWTFTVSSMGFEYVAIAVADSEGHVVWSPWSEVAQNANFTYSVGAGRKNYAYFVRGADNVGGQWEYTTVVTSWDHILVGNNYSNWWC